MKERIPQLDLLRGIAVLLVLFRHYPCFGVLRFGWIGVDLFFVLSGFLISGLLFTDWKKNQSISFSRFFIRRGFKIYPAFYFFVFTLTPGMIRVLPQVKHNGIAIITRVGAELFFLQDYLPHMWGHTWSLAIEEQFYILLPLLLWAVSKAQNRRREQTFAVIPYISLLVLIGCLVLRLAFPLPTSLEMLTPLHFRADGLFAGVALGYLFHFHNSAFQAMARWWLLPTSFLLLIPLSLCSRSVDLPRPTSLAFVFTFNILAFVCLVWWIVPRASIRAPWIERIGVHCYSIYLWHMPFAYFFIQFHFRLVWLVLYLLASITSGMFMGKIIEMRALAIRERYFPSERSARSVNWTAGQSACAVEV